MSDPSALNRLFEDYRKLLYFPPKALSYDARRSLLFYRAEHPASPVHPDHPPIPTRVMQWTQQRERLEVFIGQHGVLPRNNRRDSSTKTGEELSLAEWLRTQRAGDSAGRLCSYQQKRLDAIELFSWDPVESAWEARYNAYRAFVVENGRAPSERRSDKELTLANWASKRRAAYWAGRLPAYQEEALDRLPIWTWGQGTRQT